ncbi:cytochrome P450 [Streptomyces clavuligerus]|uniref:Putative cytochrome P450 n=1 Tax=Streptomyces clavuligerus TaxID=1901 RepID=D5SLB2_STRCL|nr:cytochrome P450 [Streptomyces clavuligerus]ANW22574.1 cytochrome [Streptomyces clavuligerus]AXU17459.1 cytochrome P450 [Streptomyces clavuligerus]EFG04705.1 putative cytochrome P450 [Streptomyces clavuligerus]MBY6306849.1 cytochrome P450 [Streptomyces clavuligerus]QCS10555.1 cytochrome P450 [Streptomyces clavuligerus]
MPTSSPQRLRTTVFSPRLAALMDDHTGQDVFRLEPDTIGVAGPEVMDRVLAARRATETERPTFKPLLGRSIPRAEASAVTRTVGADVREALRHPLPKDVDLSGPWPWTGHYVLRDLILGRDPYRLRLLMSRRLELTPVLTWSVVTLGAALPRLPRQGDGRTALADRTAGAMGYQERRYAMGMYRRSAAPVCFTVSTLVANALWLGFPFADDTPNRNIVHETLRLLPPSWNLLRNASPEYPAVDGRIGSKDDVLLLPLLSHRDPALWDDPEAFRPDRWDGLDPDRTPGYLPFGHASERCWGRHMVLPLAELLLTRIRESGLVVDPDQRTAKVPLLGLLGVDEVRLKKPARFR